MPSGGFTHPIQGTLLDFTNAAKHGFMILESPISRDAFQFRSNHLRVDDEVKFSLRRIAIYRSLSGAPKA